MFDLARDAVASLPQAIAKMGRMSRVWLSFPLPQPQRRQLERRLRGREQVAKLQRADAVVVSYGKAGRTWLRVMLSGYYQQLCGISPRRLLGFENFHRRDSRVPRVFFTHDNYIQDYTGHSDSKRDFYEKKVVLLVRSPQDVAVSQFHQWKNRMRRSKKGLNEYPEHGAEISVFDFAMQPTAGLPKIIQFMNLWASEAPKVRELLLVRYEDMRRDPQAELRRIVRFLGGEADEAALRHAVEYASVENMRAMEQRNVFWLSGGRMTPKDRANPDSYKVRRAKVGGYRDYFDDEQVARMDEIVRTQLSPLYGYGGDASAAGAGAKEGAAS